MAAKEDRGLARLDRIAVEIGGACDDEKLVAIDVGFGELVRLQRVLDRGRVEAETLRDALELARRRFVEAEPEEFALGAFVGNRLVGAEVTDELSLVVEAGGHDRHRRASCWFRASIVPGEAAARPVRAGCDRRGSPSVRR